MGSIVHVSERLAELVKTSLENFYFKFPYELEGAKFGCDVFVVLDDTVIPQTGKLAHAQSVERMCENLRTYLYQRCPRVEDQHYLTQAIYNQARELSGSASHQEMLPRFPRIPRIEVVSSTTRKVFHTENLVDSIKRARMELEGALESSGEVDRYELIDLLQHSTELRRVLQRANQLGHVAQHD